MPSKMRHCFVCGEELGCYDDYDPLDTCGKRECEREARAIVREQIEEDRDWGWRRGYGKQDWT
jgi:hypothetical protein